MMVSGAHLLFVAVIVARAAADFPGPSLDNQIKKLVYNNNGFGVYSFEYETLDGTYRREDGAPNFDELGGMIVRGEYGYKDPTGHLYTVRYIADAHGFQPISKDKVDTRFNDRKLVFGLIEWSVAVIYTYEDVELRRIFPSEFPQDTIRRSGALDPEHLGRYGELKRYFKYPKSKLNSHFEELVCYEDGKRKVCSIDFSRYSPEEDKYYRSKATESHVDRRRVYCIMMMCFTEDELDRVVASF